MSLLQSAPLVETVQALRSGEQDLHEYIDQMCDRITATDALLWAFVSEPDRRTRLHHAADDLLARYPRPAGRPALFGALVGVKDIFHVDGFVTTAGTEVPPEAFAGEESDTVRLLRGAGALIAGKTVTTEFAYFEPGPTRNPRNLEHTPGGSSSGSAAAVAAGLCPLALGTQTIGSVIRPAAYCGVVGFKPTLNRIPTNGMVYFSPTIDHVGLFTQDVDGMRLAAAEVVQGWIDMQVQEDEVPILGVPDGPYLRQASPEALALFQRQLEQLGRAGYTIWHVPTLINIDELNKLHRRLVFAEFARQHAEIYSRYGNLYRPRTVEIIEIGRQIADRELDELRIHCLELRDQLESQMNRAGIDLWVCPAAPGPAPHGLTATGDPNMNLPWTHAGMPAVTLPAGAANGGLPVGLQLVAESDEDELLLAWSGLIEADLSGLA